MTLSDPEWWRGAVIYQIYPRSFQDTNGDGVGDLPGITARLPHVASLGVDAVWIGPFFRSPMRDFGYDVSDYCAVDPLFGTLEDFDELIAHAHALGIRVMIDLVFNHTSDQHPWFREGRCSRDNAFADWHVWADPRPDGTPPNNWLSVFGGPAWHWDPRRQQYYHHSFLAAQPDLNLAHPAVQDALLDVARFWLARGVDGFRLDAANFYFHDKALRDNPSLPAELRNTDTAPRVNPYNHQRHLYDKNQPETLAFLRRLRAVLDPFRAVALGEIGDGQRGLELLGEYTSGSDLLHMSYAFEFLSGEAPPTAAQVAGVMARLDRVSPDGWPCWAFCNHDVVRHLSRWSLSDGVAKTYATLLMCLRGSVCLYQGEELGLPEADLALTDLQDPYGAEFWPEFKGRDGCRTPMVWDSAAPQAGFSPVRPWLPIPTAHLPLALDRAEADAGSILHHYRRAIALRRENKVLRGGAQLNMTAKGNVLRFFRRSEEDLMLCLFNLSADPATHVLPEGRWRSITGDLIEGALHLDSWQTVLARLEAQNG